MNDTPEQLLPPRPVLKRGWSEMGMGNQQVQKVRRLAREKRVANNDGTSTVTSCSVADFKRAASMSSLFLGSHFNFMKSNRGREDD